MSLYDDLDKYEAYEEAFDSMRTDRKARKARRPKVTPMPRREREKLIEEVVDPIELEAGFQTTYQPSQHEAGWLLTSLRTFYDEHLITDVLAVIKGGKEATVYRCAADPSTGVKLIAAKVYRPHKFRVLNNDAMYKEGRTVLTGDKHRVHTNMDRVMRALGKKTAFGREVAHTSWLMHEYTMLERLHAAGGSVPKPYAAAENALLMSYHGNARMAAPLLSEVRLERDEVEPLFEEIMRSVRLMLAEGYVHGDLSAYNILYWKGQVTLIDFPQVVDVLANRQARSILRRDVTRLCEYFARQGLRRDPERITAALWERYGRPQIDDLIEAYEDK